MTGKLLCAAVLAAAACLGADACAPAPPVSQALAGPAPATSDPRPALTAAVAAALAADDARRAALASGDTSALGARFSGPALLALEREVTAQKSRGGRVTEVITSRQAVHAAATPSGAEVVLRVAGSRTMAGARAGAFLRQWRTELRAQSSGWSVVEAADLPPPQWWPAPTT